VKHRREREALEPSDEAVDVCAFGMPSNCAIRSAVGEHLWMVAKIAAMKKKHRVSIARKTATLLGRRVRCVRNASIGWSAWLKNTASTSGTSTGSSRYSATDMHTPAIITWHTTPTFSACSAPLPSI
jgi:hypothetical protein